MQVYGQVGGIAYPTPTRISSARERRAMLKKRKHPEYAVSATRKGEDHFVMCDTVAEAIAAQAVLMADGWVTTINPPPPVLKGGASQSQRSKGKRNVNNIVASKHLDASGRVTGMSSPTAESLEFVNSGYFPQRPEPTHNVATQACDKCHMLPCDCNYPLFSHVNGIAAMRKMVGADGTEYYN
jgi:hypothetical protein